MRGRGWAWLIALGVAVGVLVLADRVGVVVAQKTAESKLAGYAQFREQPTVRIHGVPFLTQVVRGRYDDIEVRGPLVRFGDFSVADLDVHLRGAHLPFSTLIGGHISELPVDRAVGQVVVPYAELARRVPVSGLVVHGDDHGAAVSGDIAVPLIGQTVHVSGRVAVALTGDQVRITVTQLDLGSATVPQAVLDALQQQLTATVSLPRLPLDLRVTGLRTSSAGLVVTGTGDHVVLRATQ